MIQEHEVLLQNQQSILSDIRCSVEEMSRKLEEVEETEKKGIIDFGCEEDEFTMQVANCGIVRENEVEFEVEKKVLSWEDEFLGELEGLSESKQVGEFDPLGDLANLEALQEGKPEKISEPTPYVEIKYGDLPKEVEGMVEDEEHHSWPVVGVTEDSRPRERARKKEPGNRRWFWVGRWAKQKMEQLKCNHDRSYRYMPRIRFLPGKYKFWWSDPFQNFKLFYNPAIKFLTIFVDRVELNGLDRVQIKEKPPD
ncbi:hypothetical protein HanRHA438_Chr02g0060441 [Helianthus annuus]|nr:hypothetical protein HanRHA438_Chr02g0060441 [Helianthus annuus]